MKRDCCTPHFLTPAQVQRLMDVLVAATEPLMLQQLHRMGLPTQEVEEQLQPRLWPLLTIRDSRVSRSGVVGEWSRGGWRWGVAAALVSALDVRQGQRVQQIRGCGRMNQG